MGKYFKLKIKPIMKTKIEIETYLGKLLFEFEKEDNNIKDTLIEAIKQDADLWGADLRGADLQGAKGKTLKDLKQLFWIIPEEGAFIAWKKCKNSLVKISIPKEAKRTSNLKDRKCRAEFVDVIQIIDLNTKKRIKTTNGLYNNIVYEVGKRTIADSFDPDFTVDCSHGIHFFITKQEAMEFNY